MRYYRSNPTIYYVIGIIAAGVILIRATAAVTHRISAALEARRPHESDIVVSSEEERDIISEDDLWKIILVNSTHPLPEDYEDDLEFVRLRGDIPVDERIYDELQKMMDDCRAEDLHPRVGSGYRSIAYQQQLFDEKVKELKRDGYSDELAQQEAVKWVTVPGTSEHNLGMAVDIVSEDNQFVNKDDQSDSPEQKWLTANCYKYGFILRYPPDKVDITGINYESWHYRYVGVEAATYITQHGLCLEEFIDERIAKQLPTTVTDATVSSDDSN